MEQQNVEDLFWKLRSRIFFAQNNPCIKEALMWTLLQTKSRQVKYVSMYANLVFS